MASVNSGWLVTVVRSLASLALAAWVAGCGGGAGGGSAATGAAPAGGASAGAPAQTGGIRAPEYSDKLRKGDLVSVMFSGNPTPPVEQEERIKEDGTINLQYLGAVRAEGLTPGELQKAIQDGYVPKFFRRLTVTVKTENRVFYVYGEVRAPGRLMYAGEITVLRAIASSGGFTDFAARGRVELVRATGEKVRIDAKKAAENPKLDPPVIPGDTVFVPRRSPFGN